MFDTLTPEFGDDVRQSFWNDAPSRLKEAFNFTEKDEETTLDVIYEHDDFDEPIACSTELFGEIEEVAGLTSYEAPVTRVQEQSDRILITSRDDVFTRAFTLGLSCSLVSSSEDIPNTEIVGRKIVLDPDTPFPPNTLYQMQNEIEAVWTCAGDEDLEQLLPLLADGLRTTEVLGRPEIQPIGRVSADPNRGGLVFVEEDGLLCKLDFKDDGETETVPILNCVPRPVDRIREDGELFFTVRLDQQGHISEKSFDLKAEAAASYKELIERIIRAGSDLPKPPTHMGGGQRILKTGVRQSVRAQWPRQVSPARRPNHWGRIKPESDTEPVWLFAEHIWTRSRGLQPIRKNEVQLGEHRIKATPSISEDAPQVKTDSSAVPEDVEGVIGPAHGSLLAKLFSSYIALCAANVLPAGYDEPHYPLILVGPKGSGKSTAAKLAVACFGQNPSEKGEGLTSVTTSTNAGLLAELGSV